MKMKTGKTVFLALVLMLLPLTARAEAFETTARQAILVDGETGSILLNKDANARMPTSSMSKTMTMYMVFDALKTGRLKPTDTLPVSEKAWRMQGSKMFIHVGSSVSVEELVRGVIIQSGNDAAVALAEGLGGTEEAFADAMNERAKQLGMNDSHFMNASGWPDPEHYSTAHDLAILAYRIIHDFPEYYHYFSEKEFTYNKIRQQNRDPLLGRLAGADGLKTGHTEIAGYGLIGSAKRGERRLIMVLNGLDSDKARSEEGVRVMEWGFRNFENRNLVAKGESIDSARVWLGVEELVPLVAAEDLRVVMPVAKRNELKVSVSFKQPLKAPVVKGDNVGTLKIEIPDQSPIEMKLLAGADVPRKGFFGIAKDRMMYLMTGTF
jgi:serine-type D-Ala-D-Ala carboxypeptidase (penicillin-binding protein 5/6)